VGATDFRIFAVKTKKSPVLAIPEALFSHLIEQGFKRTTALGKRQSRHSICLFAVAGIVLVRAEPSWCSPPFAHEPVLFVRALNTYCSPPFRILMQSSLCPQTPVPCSRVESLASEGAGKWEREGEKARTRARARWFFVDFAREWNDWRADHASHCWWARNQGT
jgi:hypothetical protein